MILLPLLLFDHLMPLWEKDGKDEYEGAQPEDDGGGDEEELGKAGDVPPLPLHGHLLPSLVLGVEWAVVRDLAVGLGARLASPVRDLVKMMVMMMMRRRRRRRG